MEITDEQWKMIQRLFEDAFRSSFHYAIATVGENGEPHVTPIGSLILRDDRTGFYFEEYPKRLQLNLRHNKRICVMAVNSSTWAAWKSFILGRFGSPPVVRLMGNAGERREATPEEIRLFRKRIAKFRFFKAYDLLWGHLKYVREIHFDSFEPVHAGVMTQGLWNSQKEQS